MQGFGPTWLLLSALFLASGAARAAGFEFSYSGRLTDDANGKPVSGPVTLQLSFYHQAAGGSPILTVNEGLAEVPLQEGFFQVTLTLTPTDYQTVFSSVDQGVFVEITDLTHNPHAPYERQQASMVPFAGKIPIDGATLNYTSEGKLTLGPTAAPGAGQFLTKDAGGALVWATPTTAASSLQGKEISAAAPAAGQVLKFDGSQWVGMPDGNSGGTVTSVAATGPLSVTSGTTTPQISLSQASAGASGFLSSADWATFNNKQNTLAFTPLDKAGDTMGGPLDMGNHAVANLGLPLVGTDAATKSYVDTAAGVALKKDGSTALTANWAVGGFDVTTVGNLGLNAQKTLGLGAYDNGQEATLVTTVLTPAGAAAKGKTWFNSQTNQVKYWNGTAAVPLGVSGAGLTNLDGETGNTQTLSVGSTGTAPGWSSAAGDHKLNVPLASAAGVTAGLLAKTDYDSFAGKQAALGFTPVNKAGDTMGGALNMGANTVTNLAVPSAATDAATKTYVDTGLSGKQASLAFTPVNKAGDTMSGALDMGGSAVTNLPTPAGANDAARRVYVDDGLALKQNALGFAPVSKAGDTMAGALSMGGNALTSVASPSAGTDAANKTYVDNAVGPYVKKDGSTALTGNWAVGGFNLTGLGNLALNAQKTLALGAYTDSEETTLITTPALGVGDKGKTWYNSTSGQMKYWNGAAVVTLGATLPNVGTAATYTKVTTDAQGRVTSGTALAAGDIPNLDAAKITSGQLGGANGGTGVNSTATFPTAGVIVTEGATETLTNKTLTSPLVNTPTISGGAASSLTGLSIRDTSAAFDVTVAATSSTALTAGHSLTLDLNNGNRTLALKKDLTVQTGDVSLTAQAAGSAVTLPASGTLATLAGTETLAGKTLTSPAINSPTIIDGSIGGNAAINTTGAIATSSTLTATGAVTGTGNFVVNGTGVATTDLRFNDIDNLHYIGFKAPTPLAANKVWTLPAADGTSGQVLKTDGSGVLGWVSGAAPTGAAGGDLAGSFPSPTIGTGKVTSTHILDDTIVNADINSAAAIGRTKLAAGSNDHVVINSAAGVLTSEAQLAGTRGGTGVSSTATFPASGVVVTEAASETLTNKTLTSPVISSISNTGTLILPTSNDTLVGRATTDTLTNKTLTSPTINGGTMSAVTSLQATGAVGAPSYSFSGDIDTGLWSSGANTLNVSTAGAERLRVDASGNVGIGTTAPSEVLHVYSASIANLELDGSSASGIVLARDGSPKWSLYSTGSSSDLFRIGIWGVADVMTFDRSYRVGIGRGMTAPTATLHVKDGTASTGVSRLLVQEGAGQSTSEAFGVYANDGTTPRLVIQNGNVGIGTTAPNQKLAVEGTLGILETGASPQYHTIFQGGDQAADLTYTLPTAYPGSAGYVLSATTAGVLSWAAPSGGVTAGGQAGALTLGTTDANSLTLSTNNTARLKVDSAGRIGVGTATTTGGDLTLSQLTNGDTLLYSKRNTDTAPTGNFIDFKNAAASASLFTVGIDGGVTSGALTSTKSAIGSTTTDGLVLQNTTAAAAGAQQYSPRLRLSGNGWKTTATAASQSVDWMQQVVPVEGTANPTSYLDFSSSVNGGAYSNVMALTSTGNVGIGTTDPAATLDVTSTIDNNIAVHTFENTYNGAAIRFYKAKGTAASPAQTASGNDIGRMSFSGHTGTSFKSTANIAVLAEENLTETSSSGRIEFLTTPTGAIVPVTRMTVKGSGNVGIGTTTPTSTLQVAGPIATPVQAKTTTYTLGSGDSVITADATGGAYTVTLPTAVGITGRQYTVKKIDTSVNIVTVGTTSSQTIDGATTYDLSQAWQFISIVSNGTNWIVVAASRTTWGVATTGFTFNTVYLAATDGFVTASGSGSASACGTYGVVGASNPPTTQTAGSTQGTSTYFATTSFPVRKGQYWKVGTGGTCDGGYAFFHPLQ